MNNQGKMTQSKEQKKALMTNHKEMGIYESPNKELKRIKLKKLSKL
jgi:hypothetical protein